MTYLAFAIIGLSCCAIGWWHGRRHEREHKGRHL